VIWRAHEITSAAIAYTLCLPLEGIIAVAVGSIIPDFLEFVFKFRLKHRGITHFWGLYGIALLVVHYYPFAQPLIASLLTWFILGCLLHIFEDSMSKSGVPFCPGIHGHYIKLGELYKTGELSEFFTVLALLSGCLLIKFLNVKFAGDNWTPEILFYEEIKKFALYVQNLH